jgi:hypothetical protein
MRTAIVSDLHLGSASSRDLLRRPEVLEALTGTLRGADELVLLGDVIELRESPVGTATQIATAPLRAIGEAMAGRRITLLAGNHDHQLALPLIESAASLEPQTLGEPPRSGPLAQVTRALEHDGAQLRMAYPGVWVRDDVYATHGHYLDVHNTVPSFERLAIGALQRLTHRLPEGRATPSDYEAAVGPVYSLLYSIAQSSRDGSKAVRSDRSAQTWQMLAGDGPKSLKARLAGGVALPAAIKALNAAGLGPLERDLSAQALRSAALNGMRSAVDHLGITAPHVIFGHTHRSGPHPRDETSEWGPLMNTGSWIHEPLFLGSQPLESPYFPGHVVIVGDSGPPELRRLLDALPV